MVWNCPRIRRLDKIDDQILITLTYDQILSEFVLTVKKSSSDKETAISLNEDEFKIMKEKLPLALLVGRKYLRKQTPLPSIFLTNSQT